MLSYSTLNNLTFLSVLEERMKSIVSVSWVGSNGDGAWAFAWPTSWKVSWVWCASIDTSSIASVGGHSCSDFGGVVFGNRDCVLFLSQKMSLNIIGDGFGQLTFSFCKLSCGDTQSSLELHSSSVVVHTMTRPLRWCNSKAIGFLCTFQKVSWWWSPSIFFTPSVTRVAWSLYVLQTELVYLSIAVFVSKSKIRKLLNQVESLVGKSMLLLSKSPTCTLWSSVQMADKLLGSRILRLSFKPVLPGLVVLNYFAHVYVGTNVSACCWVVILEPNSGSTQELFFFSFGSSCVIVNLFDIFSVILFLITSIVGVWSISSVSANIKAVILICTTCPAVTDLIWVLGPILTSGLVRLTKRWKSSVISWSSWVAGCGGVAWAGATTIAGCSFYNLSKSGSNHQT